MALPQSRSGFEFNKEIQLSVSGGTAVQASTTDELTLTRLYRSVRFREIGITSNVTVKSGVPATNHFRAEIWNFTDSTKIAQATITGASTGTALNRLVYKSIATTAQFIGVGADVSLNKVISIKIVGTNTLSAGLTLPVVSVTADIIE